MTADIRPARASDADALLAIENAAFEGDRISRGSFQRLVSGRSAEVLVAASGDAVAGYCVVLFRKRASVARLYSIATDKRHGGVGLGRALLQAAEASARRRGRRALRLEVRDDNSRARELYERNGYRFIGRKQGYYSDGAAALRYEKDLRPPGGIAKDADPATANGTVS